MRTEFLEAIGRRVDSVIRSLPATGGFLPSTIVEQAMYWTIGAQVFAAGSTMPATRVQ